MTTLQQQQDALGFVHLVKRHFDRALMSLPYEVWEQMEAILAGEGGQQSNPTTLREALAREIADEFCGGSEAVFEAILAKLAASGTEAAPEPGIEGTAEDKAEIYWNARKLTQAAASPEAAPSLLDALNELRIRLCEIGRKEHARTRALAKQTAKEIEKILAAAGPEGEGREADLRQHIANLLMVYRTALRFIKTCHKQKAWPKDLPVTEESSNVIERAEAALRQSAAPSGGATLTNAQVEAAWQQAYNERHQYGLILPRLTELLNSALAQQSKTGAVTETK